MWEDPYETSDNEDIWSLGGGRYLRVNYNNKDEAVSTGILLKNPALPPVDM